MLTREQIQAARANIGLQAPSIEPSTDEASKLFGTDLAQHYLRVGSEPQSSGGGVKEFVGDYYKGLAKVPGQLKDAYAGAIEGATTGVKQGAERISKGVGKVIYGFGGGGTKGGGFGDVAEGLGDIQFGIAGAGQRAIAAGTGAIFAPVGVALSKLPKFGEKGLGGAGGFVDAAVEGGAAGATFGGPAGVAFGALSGVGFKALHSATNKLLENEKVARFAAENPDVIPTIQAALQNMGTLILEAKSRDLAPKGQPGLLDTPVSEVPGRIAQNWADTGAVVGRPIVKAGQAIKGVAEQGIDAVRDRFTKTQDGTPTPEVGTPEWRAGKAMPKHVKHTLDNSTQTPEVLAEKVQTMYKEARDAMDDPAGKQTPMERVGLENFEKALEILQEKKTIEGHGIREAILPASGEAVPQVPSILTKFATEVMDRFGGVFKEIVTEDGVPTGKYQLVPIGGRELSISPSEMKLLTDNYAVKVRLYENPTVQMSADVVDGIQSNVLEFNQNKARPAFSRVEALENMFQKDLNASVKPIVDAFGGGEAYSQHNANYGKYKDLYDRLNKAVGSDFAKGGSIIKRSVLSPSDSGLKSLIREVSEVTGLPIAEDAMLAQYIQESVGDARARGLLEMGQEAISALKNPTEIPGKVISAIGSKVAGEVFDPETMMLDYLNWRKAQTGTPPVPQTNITDAAADIAGTAQELGVGVKLDSGRTGWRLPLHDSYEGDFEQFKAYDETYNLAQRLGFADAQEAWDANPVIEGSTTPSDFKVAGSGPKANMSVADATDELQRFYDENPDATPTQGIEHLKGLTKAEKGGTVGSMKATPEQLARLEEIRGEIRAERVSQGELAELQDLARFIDPGDVELLEPAGVPEGVDPVEWADQNAPKPNVTDDTPVPGADPKLSPDIRKDVSPEEWQAYREVQQGGEYNMITEASDAAEAAGLDRKTYKFIQKNYKQLQEAYSGPKPNITDTPDLAPGDDVRFGEGGKRSGTVIRTEKDGSYTIRSDTGSVESLAPDEVFSAETARAEGENIVKVSPKVSRVVRFRDSAGKDRIRTFKTDKAYQTWKDTVGDQVEIVNEATTNENVDLAKLKKYNESYDHFDSDEIGNRIFIKEDVPPAATKLARLLNDKYWEIRDKMGVEALDSLFDKADYKEAVTTGNYRGAKWQAFVDEVAKIKLPEGTEWDAPTFGILEDANSHMLNKAMEQIYGKPKGGYGSVSGGFELLEGPDPEYQKAAEASEAAKGTEKVRLDAAQVRGTPSHKLANFLAEANDKLWDKFGIEYGSGPDPKKSLYGDDSSVPGLFNPEFDAADDAGKAAFRAAAREARYSGENWDKFVNAVRNARLPKGTKWDATTYGILEDANLHAMNAAMEQIYGKPEGGYGSVSGGWSLIEEGFKKGGPKPNVAYDETGGKVTLSGAELQKEVRFRIAEQVGSRGEADRIIQNAKNGFYETALDNLAEYTESRAVARRLLDMTFQDKVTFGPADKITAANRMPPKAPAR